MVEVHRLLGRPQPFLGVQVEGLPNSSGQHGLRVVVGLRHVLTGNGRPVQIALRAGCRALEAGNLAFALSVESDERAIVAVIELLLL